MHRTLAPTAEAAETIELLDVPCEFDGARFPVDVDQVRRSLDLARARREELTVIELDNPSTTTFALFL
jgi:hypothetical protein